MGYQFLVPTTSHHLFSLGKNEELDGELNLPSTLMKQTFSTAILAPCSMVRAEAEPIMLKKLAVIKQQPLRILGNMGAFPSGRTFQQWVTDTSTLDCLVRHTRSHWANITETPRTLQYPHHIEFAVNSFQTFHPNSDITFGIFSQIWVLACASGVSLAIYHKGPLPAVEYRGTAAGMWFWSFVVNICTSTKPLLEVVTQNSIVKITELKDEEWDRMVKDWRTG